MNKQDLIEAAVKAFPVWPDGAIGIYKNVFGDFIFGGYLSDDLICDHLEHITFRAKLFKGAPDDSNEYNPVNELFYKSGRAYYSEAGGGEWREVRNGHMMPVLIPRPTPEEMKMLEDSKIEDEDMIDKEKRKIMLRFAAENKGEWPSEYEYLIVATEENTKKKTGSFEFIQSKWSEPMAYGLLESAKVGWQDVCTRTEYETMLQELADAAPEGAEYYRAVGAMQFWYKKEHEKYYWISHYGLRVTASDLDSLIRLPNKAKADLKHSKNNDLAHVADTDVGKWIPEIGVECAYPTGEGVIRLPPDQHGVLIVEENGTYKRVHVNGCRPLKTERDSFIEKLASLSNSGQTIEKLAGKAFDEGARFVGDKL